MEKIEVLKVENISHKFNDIKILNDISFEINKGEIKSILGSSGCGKTTILHICAELLNQSNGTINNSFTKSSFLFQEPRLLPWQNVIDNISLPLKETSLTKEMITEKAKDIALKLGLKKNDFLKYPKDLSGGMKQRVSFARALIVEPSLLFLDEPFSALDIGLKKELYDILIQKVQIKELSVLFITHDIMEAVKLSDEVMILKSDKNGSNIINKYNFNTKFDKRDNQFIYSNMLKLADNF